MDLKQDNSIFFSKHPLLWQLAYWSLAFMLLLFVFSNNQFDISVRIVVVFSLTLMSFGVTYFINRYLVPHFLFKGKIWKFAYFTTFIVAISVWLNALSIILIIWYSASRYPHSALPNKNDLVLLLWGSNLIIMLAAIVHFVKESYTRLIEKNSITQQKAETELMLKEAKLKILQGQLHPHFLFNMLNNLYGLWMENSKATPDVILKFSDLLHYMLYECDKEYVPLRSEMQFIQNYIDLEQIRHDDRLKLDLNLPNTIDNDVSIAPLLLFSFVENAFKHGANRSVGNCSISISLKIEESIIYFEVENSFTQDVSNSNAGIGLKNVEERLNLLYSNKHILNISSENSIYRVSLQIEVS
jgi:sensor histidine kinase YesM